MGFKLNLGVVASNEVDESKPEALPHTPKGDIVQRLQREQQEQRQQLDEEKRDEEQQQQQEQQEPPPPATLSERLSRGEFPSHEEVAGMGVAALKELIAAARLNTADCVAAGGTKDPRSSLPAPHGLRLASLKALFASPAPPGV